MTMQFNEFCFSMEAQGTYNLYIIEFIEANLAKTIQLKKS
jgi:hypothetical protein